LQRAHHRIEALEYQCLYLDELSYGGEHFFLRLSVSRTKGPAQLDQHDEANESGTFLSQTLPKRQRFGSLRWIVIEHHA